MQKLCCAPGAQKERESAMPKSSDHEMSAQGISRRSFLRVSASMSFRLLPRRRATGGP